MYKDSIGLKDKYRFGVEIEFGGVKLMDLHPQLLVSSVLVYYKIRHKDYNLDYKAWYLDGDATVTKIEDNTLVGGELSSRILRDDINSWKELKKVCQVLKQNNANSNASTSTHITVDLDKHKDDLEFFETLIKIISIYEIDMNLFYMGDRFLIRRTKNRFAANMTLRLQKNLLNFDFREDDALEKFMDSSNCFFVRDGVNFTKLFNKGLIEIRYPNGTLNEETIQNNINFTLKLIQAIEDKKYDLDYLNYILREDYNNIFSEDRINNYIENQDRFNELIEPMKSDEDKKDFLKQYQKVLSTRN